MYQYRTTAKYIFDCWKNKKSIVLFGASKTGEYILELLRSQGVAIQCFCDNSLSLRGRTVKGVNILSPTEAIQQYPDALFVIASVNYGKEMQDQLMALGINNNNIVFFLWNKGYDYYENLEREHYEDEIQDTYFKLFGHYLDLQNPKTYNEKLNWRKIYDTDSRKTELSDKLLVRKWVKDKIGEKYLNKLLGQWEDEKDIRFELLPEQFVLKLNHGCGWNIIVRDKEKIDFREICKQLNAWRKRNFAYYSLEMQYEKIKPMIICEEYLENIDGDLFDYKVFCFHGEPRYIMFLMDRNKGNLKMAFYDTNWKKQPFTYSYPQFEGEVPKPKELDKILCLSRKLSEEFEQVRVDWYILPSGKIVFGEMTFTSAAGRAAWNPPIYDEIFGNLI